MTISPTLRKAQDAVAAAFGLSTEARTAVVHAALDRGTRDSAIYWLQLVLAMAIATLGLVLGSTAVVIGAMLVSPLMTPIVELGMGLAVGSPLLVLRSVVRAASSIVVVVFSAALLTVLLPFHEVTAEIAARTSPTVLDLLIAVCCALAAAYTQLRAGSDTAATAAGTAIGIALVPPLCVAGYGLGTRSVEIASGALLLFTANLSAIIVVTAASFVVLGFDSVEVRSREHEVLGRSDRVTFAVRAARVLDRLFSARSGAWLRLAMPLVFVGAVYVPLQQALREVSWEVRVRSAIEHRLAAIAQHSVGTTLVVKRHTVQLKLVVVGTPATAADLQRRLEVEIAAVAGVKPRIDVLAVAQASQLPAPIAPRPEPIGPTRPMVSAVATLFEETLRASFPTDVAGRIVDARLSVDAAGGVRVAIAHSGATLGPVAERLLADRLTSALGANVALEAVAVNERRTYQTLPPFLGASFTALALTKRFPSLSVCMVVPAELVGDAALAPLVEGISGQRGSTVSGQDGFSVWLSEQPCPAMPARSVDAGVADAPTDAADAAPPHD